MNDQIVTEEGFPHGVRCMDCGQIIEPGQAYSSRLTGIHPDMIQVDDHLEDVFLTELVCVPCGLKAAV